MGDSPWQVQALGALGLALLLIEGVALSRGARWAFAFGIPLPWKTETLDVALPDGIAGDLSDRIERLYAFDLDDYRSAFWLGPSQVGLLYWAVGFGSRNTLRIRVLRGVGVVATGLVHVERAGGGTQFRWRPMIRVAPPSLIAILVAMSGISFGADFSVGPGLAIWGVMYLGVLWWTLRQLPAMYDAVSAQIIARAAELQARTDGASLEPGNSGRSREAPGIPGIR